MFNVSYTLYCGEHESSYRTGVEFWELIFELFNLIVSSDLHVRLWGIKVVERKTPALGWN